MSITKKLLVVSLISSSSLLALHLASAANANAEEGRRGDRETAECITVQEATTAPTPTTAPIPTPTTVATTAPSPAPSVIPSSAATTPVVANDASPSPTTGSSGNYRIVLRPEPNNGQLYSADIFALDSQGRRVKQVGHADVTRSGQGSFQSDSTSPFPFALSGTSDREVSLTQAALFNGETLSNLNLRCRNLE